jgi:tRNA threonylcarbamoyladenosine biosynthesis protein TsaE
LRRHRDVGETVILEILTAQDMRDLGTRLARILKPGDLVVLDGPLGAGKTTLAQGIGAGLGVRGDVTSPTFVIARVHPSLAGGPPLVHADAYRVDGPLEIDDLDLDASVPDSVTIVEWGKGLVEGLAADRLDIEISRTVGSESELRHVSITAQGKRWDGVELSQVLENR